MQWISVEDKLPSFTCIVRVKTKDDPDLKCYFHHDKMSWLWFYGIKTSYFQDMSGKWLYCVTHWRPLNIPEEEQYGMDQT